jgi:uncharacterized membrane protein YtjA (UPF0391 family)
LLRCSFNAPARRRFAGRRTFPVFVRSLTGNAQATHHGGDIMLIWAAISLSLAIATILLGFGNGEGVVAEAARILALVFLLLFVATVAADSLRPPRRDP